MKKDVSVLTGNEAIALGALEAGVGFASAYPGTPSTEILENIAKTGGIYCQWSVNEKVALEVASGASLAGNRALAAMKHVGLNVASDPFMTLAYTGVNGGLVIVSADDPGMHSSQNEQDNRYYAKMAKVPLLEPSDSQECKDFLIKAFEISEEFDLPVLLRTTTRISHSGSLVEKGKIRKHKPDKKYIKDPMKYVMIPAFARTRHKILLEKFESLKEFSEKTSINKIIYAEDKRFSKIGIITSGVSYQYAAEALNKYPVLKLGMTNPLPFNMIKNFACDKSLIIVIEELEPFIEEQIKASGISCIIIGKSFFPEYGELNGEIVKTLNDFISSEKILENLSAYTSEDIEKKIKGFKEKKSNLNKDKEKNEIKYFIKNKIPPRPPVLCAGCMHRPVFHILKKLKVTVMGDIGCYTLSALPPISSLDTCLCMGAGVGQALGAEKADSYYKNKVVSVIGDSTFFHSGITSLIDNVFNKGTGLVIILDNRVTAMTGHQANPGIGKTLMGDKTHMILPEKIAEAVGVKNIRIVDPYDISLLDKTIKEELKREELSVIVCRQECALINKKKRLKKFYIDDSACKQCGLCMKLGCPAIEFKNDKYFINQAICTGCDVCSQICPWDSIKINNENN
ncbi:MAG: indolepyruvate ferredoxin oxidoreductase subunit alpha [Actinomycetota bacterium]|nr:indolepyruvate ferredoxin oxidoreductase subunit alpha [Actinomycetota bacterium]